MYPAAIEDALAAHWYDDTHALEVVDAHTDTLLVRVEMVMSPEHAQQILAVLLGEVGKHLVIVT